MLGLVNTQPVNVIATNKQDYYGPMLADLKKRPIQDLFQIEKLDSGYIKLRMKSSLPEPELPEVASALGFDRKVFRDAFPDNIINRVQMAASAEVFLSRLKELAIEEKRFQFKAEFTELVLQKYHKKFRLITDLWGSYAYGASRLELLEIFYEALADDGEAHIYLPSITDSTVVTAGDGDEMDFAIFLQSRLPEIFEVRSVGNHRVLMMRRSPGVSTLLLPLKKVEIIDDSTRGDVFTPMRFIFKEKKKN